MEIFVESDKYQIYNEYERVFLKLKETSKIINIGDFYGDPQVVLISEDEKYCVMGGAGIIVYYLNEPYEEYNYNIQSKQWKEWGRVNSDDTIWVEDIFLVDDKQIEIETEDMQKLIFDVY